MSSSGGGTPAVPTGPASGDLSGGYPAPVVSQVQGRPVSNAAPGNSQAFVWNGALWLPSAIVNNFAGRTGGIVPTTGDYTAAQVTNAADKAAAAAQSFTGDLLTAGRIATAGNAAANGPILGGGQRVNASGVSAVVVGTGSGSAGIQMDDGTINWQIDNTAQVLRFFITGTLVTTLSTGGDFTTNGGVKAGANSTFGAGATAANGTAIAVGGFGDAGNAYVIAQGVGTSVNVGLSLRPQGTGVVTAQDSGGGHPNVLNDGSGNMIITGGIRLSNGSGAWFSGTGAPGAGLGSNGDAYLRIDTPGTANQRIYVKSAGVWVGVV